jgi:predicted DNA-binding transcriptional regulator AlpA
MSDLPELVGAAEVAEILGVSGRRVLQLRAHADFPVPAAVLVGATVWIKSDIEAYASARAERVARHDPTPKRRATA